MMLVNVKELINILQSMTNLYPIVVKTAVLILAFVNMLQVMSLGMGFSLLKVICEIGREGQKGYTCIYTN